MGERGGWREGCVRGGGAPPSSLGATGFGSSPGLGESVAWLGDLDGSGWPEMAVGAPGSPGGGQVFVVYLHAGYGGGLVEASSWRTLRLDASTRAEVSALGLGSSGEFGGGLGSGVLVSDGWPEIVACAPGSDRCWFLDVAVARSALATASPSPRAFQPAPSAQLGSSIDVQNVTVSVPCANPDIGPLCLTMDTSTVFGSDLPGSQQACSGLLWAECDGSLAQRFTWNSSTQWPVASQARSHGTNMSGSAVLSTTRALVAVWKNPGGWAAPKNKATIYGIIDDIG